MSFWGNRWVNWTPSVTASVTNPTNWTGTGRYTRVGKTITGWGRLTAATSFTRGSGSWTVTLPVACKDATLFDAYSYKGPLRDIEDGSGVTYDEQLYARRINVAAGQSNGVVWINSDPSYFITNTQTMWETQLISGSWVAATVGAYLHYSFSYEAS